MLFSISLHWISNAFNVSFKKISTMKTSQHNSNDDVTAAMSLESSHYDGSRAVEASSAVLDIGNLLKDPDSWSLHHRKAPLRWRERRAVTFAWRAYRPVYEQLTQRLAPLRHYYWLEWWIEHINRSRVTQLYRGAPSCGCTAMQSVWRSQASQRRWFRCSE